METYTGIVPHNVILCDFIVSFVNPDAITVAIIVAINSGMSSKHPLGSVGT